MDGQTAHAAYYQEVEAAYDEAAAQFGNTFGMGAAGARAKACGLRLVQEQVPSGGRLLDIGCDLGYESIMLASRGYRVVGIDLSKAMLRLAQERRSDAGLPEEVCRFLHLRAADVDVLAEAGERFDGAFSFYGALNLEPDLPRCARGLARVLPPGAPLIVGLLNPTVLYELMVYPLALRFKGWRKATQHPVRLKIARGAHQALDCHLYSPRGFARSFAPAFQLEACRAVHFLLPPPTGTLLRHPRLLSAVNRWEERVAHRWPWNRIGYFTLLRLRRAA